MSIFYDAAWLADLALCIVGSLRMIRQTLRSRPALHAKDAAYPSAIAPTMMSQRDVSDSVPERVDGSIALDASVVPEVVSAMREERIGRININVLLQRVTEHHEDPDAVIARTEKMLALAEKYEGNRLRAFTDRANAIIDVKTRDPDEVEKRQNNRTRRCLKYAVGAMSFAALGGALLCVWTEANVVLAGLFGCSGALGLAMLGPMATGESVSSTDIVRIVNAIRGAADEADDGDDRPARNKRKRKR